MVVRSSWQHRGCNLPHGRLWSPRLPRRLHETRPARRWMTARRSGPRAWSTSAAPRRGRCAKTPPATGAVTETAYRASPSSGFPLGSAIGACTGGSEPLGARSPDAARAPEPPAQANEAPDFRREGSTRSGRDAGQPVRRRRGRGSRCARGITTAGMAGIIGNPVHVPNRSVGANVRQCCSARPPPWHQAPGATRAPTCKMRIHICSRSELAAWSGRLRRLWREVSNDKRGARGRKGPDDPPRSPRKRPHAPAARVRIPWQWVG